MNNEYKIIHDGDSAALALTLTTASTNGWRPIGFTVRDAGYAVLLERNKDAKWGGKA